MIFDIYDTYKSQFVERIFFTKNLSEVFVGEMWMGGRTWFCQYSCAGLNKYAYLLQLILLLLLTFFTFLSSTLDGPSSCGDIHNISCPFYLKADLHHNCDHHGLLSQQLHCQDNRTIISLTGFSDRYSNYEYKTYKYHVADINYQNYTLRLTDTYINQTSFIVFNGLSDELFNNTPITIMNCPAPLTSDHSHAFSGCSNNTYDHEKSFSTTKYRPAKFSYVVSGLVKLRDVVQGCKVSYAAWVSSDWHPNITNNKRNVTLISKADDEHIHREVMAYGFDVPWEAIFCFSSCRRTDYGCVLSDEFHAYKCQPSSRKCTNDKHILTAIAVIPNYHINESFSNKISYHKF